MKYAILPFLIVTALIFGIIIGAYCKSEEQLKTKSLANAEANAEAELVNIYRLLEQMADSSYQIKLQQSAILHYAVPHKKGERVMFCPICFGSDHKVQGMPGYRPEKVEP